MSLLTLPNELLLQTSTYLTTPDLSSLTRTNRRLHYLLTPLLHKIGLTVPDLSWGDTLLHWASKQNHLPLVRTILSSSTEPPYEPTSPNSSAQQSQPSDKLRSLLLQRNKLGWTPLHWASLTGHTEICRLLLEHGGLTLAEARSKGGQTALHFAASENHEDVVRLLLEAGVEVEARNKWGETALEYTTMFEKVGPGYTELINMEVLHLVGDDE
jgi:ankyrin repeat protein